MSEEPRFETFGRINLNHWIEWEGPAMIRGFQGVFIWTDDLARLLPFYRDVLGLPLEFVTPAFAGFRLPNGMLGLGLHSEVHGPAKDPYRIMINLVIEDMNLTYRRLEAQGVQFIRQPSPEAGASIATFRDPDGNVLQLMGPVIAEEEEEPGN